MLNEPNEALLSALRDTCDCIAPEPRFLTEPRGLYTGSAALVARPSTTAEVAQVVKLCAEARVGIVPHGGGTGLVGGQVKTEGPTPILLSLSRMRAIRSIRPDDGVIIAEAGATLTSVQDAAREANRLFPLDYASKGTATIGGGLAVNSGGLQAIRYGVARDMALGLEVVTARGEVWDGLTALRKDNTGYDLRDLFIGSEGTLGVICAAALKLFPQPRAKVATFAGVSSPTAALALLTRAQDASNGAAAVAELMPRFGVELVLEDNPGARDPLNAPAPWYALIELWGADETTLAGALEGALSSSFESGDVQDAAIATSESQRLTFRQLREGMSESQTRAGGSIKHDISLPLSSVAPFIDRANAAVIAAISGARPCPFGHLGDGNLHYNISQPTGMDRAKFLERWNEINEIVHDIVADFGGSISAEHGIGRLKRAELVRTQPSEKLRLGRTIKSALDPDGIMNPGALY